MVARRSILVSVVTALALVVSCSGNDPITYPPAETDEGLSGESIQHPVMALDFAEFVVNATLFSWDDLGQLDVSYSYDPATYTWTKTDSTIQRITVGGPGLPSTEILSPSVAALEIQFWGPGGPQKDLLTATSARMTVRIHQLHYVLDTSYPIDETYDVTVHFQTTFRLDTGSADTVVAEGTVEGWRDRTGDSGHPRLDFDGTAELEFDFPGHYVHCPAQHLSADIRVLADGVELDRFTGTFSADADAIDYEGMLLSGKGPGGFGIHGMRSCPDSATRTAPVPMDLEITRVGR